MSPIYIMAAITLAVSVILWGGLLVALSRRRRYLWLLLAELPLSALVNLALKAPLSIAVARAAEITTGLQMGSPGWFILFLALLAPVMEEAIKLAPFLLAPMRAWVRDRAGALYTGLALGISFGLGEAAYLAYSIAQAPQYSNLSWYTFTGYLGERVAVCLGHGILTAIAVSGLQRGGWYALWGYLAAVGLHLLLNASVILARLGLVSLDAAGLGLLIPLVLLAVILEWLRRRATREESAQDAGEVVYYQRPLDTK